MAMIKTIVPEEVALEMITDAEAYIEKRFVLRLTDADGRQTAVELDGIPVGDLIADARDAGLPVGWELP